MSRRTDIYRVLQIGAGFGRRVQLPVFAAHPRFTVTAVASGRAGTAAAAASEFGIPHHGGDWRELLSRTRDQVDVVCVSTPVALHRDPALAAFAAQKHLLLEKPAAMNAEEAAEIARAGASAGCAAAVDHEFRYRPEILTLRRLIADGRLGALRGLEIRDFASFWADPAAPTFGWLSRSEDGGGLLGALGSHNVDSLWFLSGRAPILARGRIWTEVPARADREGNLRPVTADDNAAFTVELEGGVVGRIDISGTSGRNEHWVRAHGSRGAAHVEGGRIRIASADGAEETVGPDPDLDWTSPETDIRRPLFSRLLDRFALRLDGEEVADLATLDQAIRVMEVLDAVRKGAA